MTQITATPRLPPPTRPPLRGGWTPGMLRGSLDSLQECPVSLRTPETKWPYSPVKTDQDPGFPSPLLRLPPPPLPRWIPRLPLAAPHLCPPLPYLILVLAPFLRSSCSTALQPMDPHLPAQFFVFPLGRGSRSASPRPPYRSDQTETGTRAKRQRRASLLSLKHIYLLLLRAGIEQNPGPPTTSIKDPCAVCGRRVAGGWLAFRCCACSLWCHRRCAGINTEADYLRLAPWSCPTCAIPAPPSSGTREPESSDLEGTLSSFSSSGTFHSAFSGFTDQPSCVSPAGSGLSPSPQTVAPQQRTGARLEGGSILQFNCNGIHHCRAELQDYLTRHQVKVACLQETKLYVGSTLREFDQYTSVRRDRPAGRGGGLITLVHHSSTFKELNTGNIFPNDQVAEIQGIEVWMGGCSLRIVNVYIPPPSSCPPGYAPEFDRLLDIEGDGLIVGDFNAHHPSWYSRTEDDRAELRGVSLDAAASGSNFGFLNEDSPTRLPSQGPPSSPDVSLASAHLLLDMTWSTHITLGSDHLPILITLSGQTSPPRKARSFVNFQRADWEGFTLETEVVFASAPPPTSCAQGELLFRSVLVNAARHHIPAGYRKNYTGRLPPVARTLTQERDRLSTLDPTDPAIRPLEVQIQQSIRQDAQDQWQSYLDSCDRSTNPSRYWSFMRKLAGKRSPLPPNITITIGGKECSGPKTIARAFTKQFTTTVEHQQDPLMRRLTRKIHDHHPLDRDFRPFSVRDVEGAIRKAGSSTARGPDGLSTVHLKHLGALGLAYLTELYNLSVAGADLPAIWKNSTIIPILKPGKPRNAGGSYRPISLLSPAVKILERLVLPELTLALGTRSSQHGFKPHHSTVSALLPVAASIAEGFNLRKPPSRTVAVAVDISKAFDTVNHRLLLEMICHSRLGHNLVRWLAAYLRGRKAACLYNGHVLLIAMYMQEFRRVR